MNPCPKAWVFLFNTNYLKKEVSLSMASTFDREAFKEKLESAGQFPMLYMFKFIVPKGREIEVEALFPKNEIGLKPSSGGKYVSTTIKAMMDSPEQIIAIYERASLIEGVISL